jgi:hypothetical protein
MRSEVETARLVGGVAEELIGRGLFSATTASLPVRNRR